MNDEIKEILNIIECWKNGDYVLAYSFNYDRASKQNDKLLDYITNLQQENNNLKTSLDESQEVVIDLQQENERLKFYLNDVVFDDNNIDVELSARYLRKLGYIDFDEERQVYVNKHNNQPFMQEDTKEKSFYIKDDELNDYTKQLENKIEKAKDKAQKLKDHIDKSNFDGMTKSILIMGINEIIYILNGRSDE